MNLIHQLTLQLRFPQGSSVEEVDAVADTCYDTYCKKAVEDTLERLGKRYDIEVESMQIDLGTLALEDIPYVLPARLESELLNYVNQGDVIDEIGLKNFLDRNGGEVLPNEIRALVMDGMSVWQSEKAADKMQIFLAYLLDERIPWQMEAQDFNPQKWADECIPLIFSDVRIIRAFSHFLQTFPSAYVRCRNLWRESLSTLLPLPLFEDNAPVLQTTVTETSGTEDLSFAELCERTEIREIMAEGMSVWKQTEAASEKMRIFLAYLWDGRIPWQTEVRDFNPQTCADECIPLVFANVHVFRAFFRFLQAYPLARMRCRNLWGKIFSEALPLPLFGDSISVVQTSGYSAVSSEHSSKEEEELQEIQTEEIPILYSPKENKKRWVDDAGIVLLHPFFNTLFHRLELLDEKSRFKNTSSVERAVHLLKYLADTTSSHFSHQLNLEKILCGLPCHYPMRHRFEVTEKEKDEVSQVLKAACDYWKPLNGTSEEGFRQSFLRRSGEMEYADQSWLLKVEGMAVDILMDDLPWEISVITLPWMKDPLMVDWQWNY